MFSIYIFVIFCKLSRKLLVPSLLIKFRGQFSRYNGFFLDYPVANLLRFWNVKITSHMAALFVICTNEFDNDRLYIFITIQLQLTINIHSCHFLALKNRNNGHSVYKIKYKRSVYFNGEKVALICLLIKSFNSLVLLAAIYLHDNITSDNYITISKKSNPKVLNPMI